jgi:cytochrome c biogenesis protein CcmG/thiol:disulfide interchange protein DsbE
MAVKRLSPFAVAVIAGVLALVGLLAYGLSQNEPDRGIERALARGEAKEAPGFTAPRLEGGGSRSLADYRGQVVVLNFWASWCDPCREESPLLDRWHRKAIAAGTGTVLGVDVLDVADDARDFVREYGLDYPMLRDGDGDVLGEYGVIAYPETFVIDRRGRIVASRRGPVDEAFMRREVAPLLEPS